MDKLKKEYEDLLEKYEDLQKDYEDARSDVRDFSREIKRLKEERAMAKFLTTLSYLLVMIFCIVILPAFNSKSLKKVVCESIL